MGEILIKYDREKSFSNFNFFYFKNSFGFG